MAFSILFFLLLHIQKACYLVQYNIVQVFDISSGDTQGFGEWLRDWIRGGVYSAVAQHVSTDKQQTHLGVPFKPPATLTPY